MKDTRIVYGARCAYWDSIDKVGSIDGLPCCPHCKGMLFEMASEKVWYDGVDSHTAGEDPQYRKFIDWLRGKCFPEGYPEARAAYHKAMRNLQ